MNKHVYYKSRVAMREAAEKRLAETTEIIEQYYQDLHPVCLAWYVPSIEALAKKLETIRDEGVQFTEEDVVKLGDTLIRYFTAKAAQTHFRIVSEHIATFLSTTCTRGVPSDLPDTWVYVELDEESLIWYFEPYRVTALTIAKTQGMEVSQLKFWLKLLDHRTEEKDPK